MDGFPLLLESPPAGRLHDARIAWLHAARACSRLARAARAAAREDPARFGPATEALFDLVAASDALTTLVPSGRVPVDFATRCLKEAARRADAVELDRRALRIGARLRDGALPTGSALGMLERLASAHPGEPEEGLGPGEIALPGTHYRIDRRGRLRARDTLPGSTIALGPALVSGRAGLRVSRRSAGAPHARARLGKALALVDAVWAEAGAEVRARTRLVLLLEEPDLVSYSHLHRPGVSYLNLRRKTLVDLADDLVHETAHHRLHAVEEQSALFPRPAAGDEPRYWSPWRKDFRPVRGIYHAAYTFSFRAELLRRIVRAARRGERLAGIRLGDDRLRRLAQEALRERRQLLRSVRDLEHAARRGLLSAAGRRLLSRIRSASRR